MSDERQPPISNQTREPIIRRHADWSSNGDRWRGVIEGDTIDTGITILFYESEETGIGPRWHVHPYDEMFIVRQGRALFTIGDQKIEAQAGDVLMGPANIPHKYHNLGPGLLQTTDIHLSKTWIQTDLEDPELSE